MAISRRHEMPQQPILFFEVFDVWGIDFIGPFLVSNGYSYILLAIDYDSRWVKAIATKTNDAKVVVDFLKSNIFCRLGVLKDLISDQGSHFCNRVMSSLLENALNCLSIPPRQMAKQKYSIGKSRKYCKRWLIPTRRTVDVVWEHRIAYRTPLRMSPYRIVFGKACHLPIEIEHRAYLAIRQCNMAYDQASKERKLQLQELEELRLEAYENSRIYKQKVNPFHDRQILGKEFYVSQKVLLFNSHLKLITIELKDEITSSTFQVNKHQIKNFHEVPTPIVGDVESISLMELAILDDTS
ncbi:gag-pol, partial [Mucuna pruriens]